MQSSATAQCCSHARSVRVHTVAVASEGRMVQASQKGIALMRGVNVNTTDATTGATHCYCPLRIHTPYMTPYETRSMRALAALRMVWASAAWMAVDGDVGKYVVREEAAGGCAALAISRVVSGAGEARLTREEAEDGHERGCERASGFGDE